jgi:hypothetical protein
VGRNLLVKKITKRKPMESLELRRRAILLASLGNKISSKPVKISDIYADLKEFEEERISRVKATQLSPPDDLQD